MAQEFTQKIYGGPGTGKTTHLLTQLQEELENGVEPQDIAFLSFTRDAQNVASSRALGVIHRHGYGEGSLRYFRTFHSLANGLLMSVGERPRYVSLDNRIKFAEGVGMAFSDKYDNKKSGSGGSAEESLRSTRVPLGNYVYALEEWLTNNLLEPEDWWRANTLPPADPEVVMRFVRMWRAWKARSSLLTHADLLRECLQRGLAPPTRVLFVDEFQDLNPLQYSLYSLWERRMERVYIAGDDDQCVFGFQGARAWMFLRTSCTEEIVLGETRRLPRIVWTYANGLISRVQERKQKDIRAVRGPGEVVVLERPDFRQVLRHVDPLDTFILARNGYQVDRIRYMLREEGIPFTPLGGPTADGALWTPRLLALRHAIEALYRGGAVAHGVAEHFLESLPPHDPAAPGYVEPTKLKAFKALPTRFAATWPRDPLGQSLDSWGLAELATYMARVPSRDDVLHVLDVKADKRSALRTSLERRPDWPTILNQSEDQRGLCVGTIHASKGREARVVILLADESKKGVARNYASPRHLDDETRVFYVGATRASEKLVVCRPLFNNSASFPLPNPPLSKAGAAA